MTDKELEMQIINQMLEKISESKNPPCAMDTFQGSKEASLEERADIAYDNADYATAASLYKQLADIALKAGDLKAYTDYLYLCGICYCENKEYENGRNLLFTVCKYYHYINGGASREERAVLEAIVEYMEKEPPSYDCKYASYFNDHLHLDTENTGILKHLFEICTELDENIRLKKFEDYIYNSYQEILESDVKNIHICSYQNNLFDNEDFFNRIDLICKWCTLMKDVPTVNNLAIYYLNLLESLLYTLFDLSKNPEFFVQCSGHFATQAIAIGQALLDMFAYTEAKDFLYQCIDMMNPMLVFLNDDADIVDFEPFKSHIGMIVTYACALKISGCNELGIITLANLINKFEKNTYQSCNKINELIGVAYEALGIYHDALEPRDIKSAIKAYESAIEHRYYPAAKDLGKLYAELDMIDKEKALYEDTLEKSDYFEIQERLAGIYKDEFNYKEAVRLYQQLITNADPFHKVQYEDEMYRCMAFLEVDTAETLEILEKMHHNHLATEGQASLESVKDLRALAYAYVSYANNLKQRGDITGHDNYRTVAEETYHKFFKDARPLVSEALKKDNIEKLLPYVREYAYVLQGYLELLDGDNINHLFDLVASYQAFTFEIDRLRSDPSLWQSLQQEDICAAISEHLRNDTTVLNYVLYYRDHRRRYGVFFLKRDTLAFYDLCDAANLSEKAAGFLSAVTDFGKELAEVKIHLKDALLNPFSEELEDIKNLYVVRESGLENIPFHFLTEKDTTELISVRALLRTDRNRMDMSHVTIFSDPKYSFDDHEIRPDPYPALTGSHIEAGLIEDIYEESVDRHSGKDANASRLRQAVKGSDSVLHISSHHIRTYEKNSGYMAASRLILAGANNMEMTEEEKRIFGRDGTVSAAELNAQQMQQKLVVLAACQSANGITVEGGGGFGLARAFYTHGCRVVSALYPVGDFASAVFFYFFYQDLKQSEDPDSAIRFARDKIQNTDKDKVEDILLRSISKNSSAFKRLRRELRHLGEYPFRHPFFWSGFILGGV